MFRIETAVIAEVTSRTARMADESVIILNRSDAFDRIFDPMQQMSDSTVE